MANDYLSLQQFPGDGVTTDFSVNFAGGTPDAGQGTTPYLDVSNVKAYEIVPADGIIPGSIIPRAIEVLGPLQFRVAPAVAAGHILEIARETPNENSLVDFKSLQAVSEYDLDVSNRQLLFLTQESFDRSKLATLSADRATVGSAEAVNTAAEAVDIAEGAVTQALTATNIANQASNQADTATNLANAANVTAGNAVDIAIAATQTADGATLLAQDALGVATGIEATANQALDTANSISGTADLALSTANAAITESGTAYHMAETALDAVSEAGVSSFNGRGGQVVPMPGDYYPSMIPTGVDTNLEDTLIAISGGFDQMVAGFADIRGDLTDFEASVDSLTLTVDGIPAQLDALNVSVANLSINKLGAGDTAVAAAKLATARNINGVAFDGTANITVADSTKLSLTGGTLTGNLTISTGGEANLNMGAGGWYLYGHNTGAGIFHSGSGSNMQMDANGMSLSGNFLASGNVTAFSDRNLKTDIQRIENALDKVCLLSGYTYTRLDTGDRQTGVIAQEVRAVLPEAVTDGEHLSVAYGNMVGILIEAIKELRKEVQELKEAIND